MRGRGRVGETGEEACGRENLGEVLFSAHERKAQLECRCPDLFRQLRAWVGGWEPYGLSSKNRGSHWSPGSGIARGRAICACCAAVRLAASGRSESCCWSGTGGAGRGDWLVMGVLIAETSWLPGFGGGAGGVLA